ncbi:GNAT family N-acetyltransferase [Xenorhabdus bovienii]|uniref:GNAT family N-acetyltransferase n=1 Tax=Xenorhabdus bovienii TaxID=40576 RepID=UPI00237C87E6|nr:GNAT family N-acetyltransferase [Xenorhabdus bovienii]MDE1496034.1 GNAT family N-acetyltransferase [Xenorhabdus bovienii]MDE9474053.1 GNAT family N-acetyltransferase [Xenorhabdus bovienii]
MLTIREATIRDAVLLSQLIEESYRFHFSHLWHNKTELEEYVAEESSPEKISNSLNTANHKWFIAETHHPVCFGKIAFYEPLPDSDLTGVYLHKLHLMPHQTGQKYGEQLFDHIVKLGQEQGLQWLWLDVLEQNTLAIKFYKRKGMKWYKNIIFSSPKQKSTLHIMTKPI